MDGVKELTEPDEYGNVRVPDPEDECPQCGSAEVTQFRAKAVYNRCRDCTNQWGPSAGGTLNSGSSNAE